jgi:hypothetical protein
MLVKFLVNSGCKMFSAKILFFGGCLGLYSNLVFSTKDISSLELITDSKGNSDIISRENKNLLRNKLPLNKQLSKDT